MEFTEADDVLVAEVTFDGAKVEFTATVTGAAVELAPVDPLTAGAIVTFAEGKVVATVVVGGAVGGRNSKGVQLPETKGKSI